MNDENIILKVLKNLNVNPKTFALRATSSAIKDSLKRKTSEAYEKGIFEHQLLFQIIKFSGVKTE